VSAARDIWSNEARILVHPYRTYSTLKDVDNPSVGDCILRALRLCIAFGAFVSFTVDGRLSAPLFFDGIVCWSIVPAVEAVLVLTALSVIGVNSRPRRQVLVLFFSGNGPWIAWLILVAGVPLIVAQPPFLLFPHTASGFLPASFLVALVWALVVRHAFFNRVVGLTAAKAAIAVCSYFAVQALAIVTYLFAMGIVAP
jgi:hypothetical protein